MGMMKEFDIRIRSGGDDAIAAVSELMSSLQAEIDRLRITDVELEAISRASEFMHYDAEALAGLARRLR